MTNAELYQRLSDLEGILLKLTEKKPSKFRQFLDRYKQYIIPFVIGLLIGVLSSPNSYLLTSNSLPQQAATGGAAIPFPSGSSLPSLLYSPLGNSTGEPTDSSLTSTSEESSPSNPQADNGQKTSTQYYRVPPRRR
ncbi:MAG: hypothetical protein LBI05_08965, partial [Planctomycetaceae bacterium]|nr:hypothetical protein [Planctomycetaceae bacterium]